MAEVNEFNESNVGALIKAGRATTSIKANDSPLPKERNGKPYIVLRDKDGNESIRFIDETFDRPHHKTGTVQLQDARGFLQFFETFAGEDAQIYATLKPAVKFVAVLNENGGKASNDAAWRDHRAELTLAMSDEWTAWLNKNGMTNKFDGGVDFAEWLEDRLVDVISPPNGVLQEIALNIKVTSNIAYRQAARLTDGKIQFNYEDMVDGVAGKNGELAIPEKFVIEIPIFQGFEQRMYSINARFRYRLVGGRLSIWYELERPAKVLETAFFDVWKQIEDATNKKILLGTP